MGHLHKNKGPPALQSPACAPIYPRAMIYPPAAVTALLRRPGRSSLSTVATTQGLQMFAYPAAAPAPPPSILSAIPTTSGNEKSASARYRKALLPAEFWHYVHYVLMCNMSHLPTPATVKQPYICLQGHFKKAICFNGLHWPTLAPFGLVLFLQGQRRPKKAKEGQIL